MAKVVHHEARWPATPRPARGRADVDQPAARAGGRFGSSICEVANQRGQFFDTAAYRPSETSETWQAAVDVSRETLSGQASDVAPGAMFFRASYAPANSFFRTRQRVAAVGDHIFYR